MFTTLKLGNVIHTMNLKDLVLLYCSTLNPPLCAINKKRKRHTNAFGKFKDQRGTSFFESMFCKIGATVVTPQLLVVHRRTDG